MLLKKVYYLTFCSGNQLRRDLNLILGLGKYWKLPFFWAPLLRDITGPVLALVFSFAYPGF
jgi:solute carrier family 6 GABA transporter-like protein 1